MEGRRFSQTERNILHDWILENFDKVLQWRNSHGESCFEGKVALLRRTDFLKDPDLSATVNLRPDKFWEIRFEPSRADSTFALPLFAPISEEE